LLSKLDKNEHFYVPSAAVSRVCMSRRFLSSAFETHVKSNIQAHEIKFGAYLCGPNFSEKALQSVTVDRSTFGPQVKIAAINCDDTSLKVLWDGISIISIQSFALGSRLKREFRAWLKVLLAVLCAAKKCSGFLKVAWQWKRYEIEFMQHSRKSDAIPENEI